MAQEAAAGRVNIGGVTQVTNGKFTVDGKPFVFAGWNIWNVLEAAAHVPGGRLNTLKYDGRLMIRKLMDQAVDRCDHT